jgi:hypothetical protein
LLAFLTLSPEYRNYHNPILDNPGPFLTATLVKHIHKTNHLGGSFIIRYSKVVVRASRTGAVSKAPLVDRPLNIKCTSCKESIALLSDREEKFGRWRQVDLIKLTTLDLKIYWLKAKLMPHHITNKMRLTIIASWVKVYHSAHCYHFNIITRLNFFPSFI